MSISIKNKTLLFVGSVLLIFVGALIAVMAVDQKEKLKKERESFFENTQKAYTKILSRHQDFYLNRLKANISSKGVAEAFSKKDRARLYELTKGRWETLKKENKHLTVMHFHLPNGTSFLRMHEPEKFGDDIAKFRPMVSKIHKTKEPLQGFEAGIFNLAYRVFAPIFYDGEYIGALEFGSRPDHLLEEMEYYNGLKGALFVKNSNLNLYSEKKELSISDYTLQYETIGDKTLLLRLKEIDYDFNRFESIKYNDRYYSLYVFDLYDFQRNTSAKALFVQDVTSLENDFWLNIGRFALFAVGFFWLVLVFINIGFKKIMSQLETSNQELKKNKLFMESILENSHHAIIATGLDGKITLFNKSAEELLGYKASEMIGVHTPTKFHDQQEIAKRGYELGIVFDKSVEPGFETLIEKTKLGIKNSDFWTYVKKNGEQITVELHIAPLKDASGNINGYLGVAEDVTQKIKIEAILKAQKEELETILHTSKDGIAILDLDTNFSYANEAYLKMIGYEEGELLTKSCAQLSAPEDIERAKKIVQETIQKGFVENFEKSCITKGKERITVNMSIALMPDKKRLLVTSKNITEEKRVQKQISNYIKLVDENIITSSTDLDGNITYASEAFCQISGYKRSELIGVNHRIIRHPDSKKEIFEDMWQKLVASEVWSGELKNLKKDGGHYWVKTIIYPIFGDNGEKIGYTAIRQDITDKKRIEEISITDGLTGIYNRRYFNDIFHSFITGKKTSKENRPCFILMDIDHFKQYNDTYGHQKGDEVLIGVAKAIKDVCEPNGAICFRLGGEEFGVIFESQNAKSAEGFADEIRRKIEGLKILHEKSSASEYVTGSFGVSIILSEDLSDEDIVYKSTDDLLYNSKRDGRNRVCVQEI